MFTPTKLIFLGLILIVVWTIFKTIERRNALARDKKGKTAKGGAARAKTAKGRAAKDAAIDLKECTTCGAWVDAPCGEENCPIKS